ncbi:alpha/beta hydrolase [Spongiimicrobium sp. 2-473A-2-J]|uniref:alpha/beta hydrolase n=1 Tax=Eudoraea algarum TaxID=3417568 RepID=UPI003D36A227
MRKLRKTVILLLVLPGLLLTMLYFIQEKLIFLPTRLPADYGYTFRSDFEELFLPTEDGARLNALHFKQPGSQGVILYFHGNAGDLSRWGTVAPLFMEKGYDVLVMDYRTYGKSTGKLSEAALHKDAQRFYDYLLQRYNENQIVLYGRSLGSGVAARLASGNQPAQLILETPYYSLMDVAQERFPFLPMKWLLKYKLPSHSYVQEVTCPITIFHGTDDRVVPYGSGQRLFEAIPGPQKRMYTIEGGGHNNLIDFRPYHDGIDTVLGQSKSPEDK